MCGYVVLLHKHDFYHGDNVPEGLLTLDSLELHKLNIKIHRFSFSHSLEKMHVLPKNPVHSLLSYGPQNSDPTSYFVHGLALHYSVVTYAGYTYNLKL